MFSFGQLGERSIREQLKRMVGRAAVAGPLHVLGFCIGVSLRDDGFAHPLLRASLAALIFAAGLRFVLWGRADRMTGVDMRRALWRLGFALSSVLIAISWSVLDILDHRAFGMDARMTVTHLFCTTLAAISTQAFSFELELNVLFQILMLGPPAVVLVMSSATTDAYLGGGMVLYMLFTIYLAANQSRTLRGGLRKNEIIDDQRAAMNAIINSIEEVLLVFDARHRCVSAPSPASALLLGRDVTGEDFTTLLDPNGAARETNDDWLDMIFAQPDRFDVFVGLGPEECVIGGRELSLRYNALRKDQALEGLVVTVKDVSAERQAARQAKAERYRSDLILGAFEHPDRLRQALGDAERVADQLSGFGGGPLDSILFTLHGVKGTARVVGAWQLAELIHQTELDLRANGGDAAYVREAGARLQVRRREWLAGERALLQSTGVFDDGALQVSEARLRDLEAEVANDPPARAALLKIVARLRGRELGEVLRGYEAHVRATAERLGKQITYVVEGAPLELPEHLFVDVLPAFVHLFNNAIDHGLETPEGRRAAGKPAAGRLRVAFALNADGTSVRLMIDDDGRGIDADRLRASLRRGGHDDAMPDAELIQHVFDSGVSTAVVVTDVSGLGVGLSALRLAISRAGGTIEVERLSVGTRFRIDLPLALDRRSVA